jgi:acyl CoA:acetate/3-ketoacid CoA transferase alpha subunit/acyl CoA:acetate/3-ketoacid CoA transferase beta subunit
MSGWRELVDGPVAQLRESRRDKRVTVAEAVRRFVRPGQCLNPCALQTRPVALLHEICRQFAGRDPGFDFVSSALSGNYLQLAAFGLLRRAIQAYAGEGYPTPGPSPVVARALARGLALENWTMLTISQRLFAGAQGVSATTTRSLVNSDLGRELEAQGLFREVPDPFRAGETLGLLPAIRPDLALVHVWAADAAGNAVCFPPYQENVYGAFGAREGVMLTCERIVSSDFVRRHAHLVRIPAERVISVSEVPYGSHPYGNYARGVPEFRAYANDYAFMREHRRAQDREADYDAWLRDWILEPKTPEAYREKLGRAHFEALHAAADPESWRSELELHAAQLDLARPANAIEEMIVQGGREIARRIEARGFRTVLSGVGQAMLMAWLASHLLRDSGAEFALMAETGMYGHDPRPADPFLLNYRNLPTTTLLTDIVEALGIHACGGSNRCLATLGAGQLDRFGNINSSRARDGGFLVGSGGANDLASAAEELFIAAVQRRGTFCEKVDFVTSPGARVRCVVSTLGRFERDPASANGELVLTGWFAAGGPDEASVVAKIREHCGFEPRIAPRLERLAPATPEEIAWVRIYDPERSFLGRA